MKIIIYMLMSTFLYLVGLTFTLLRIFLDLGHIPTVTWLYVAVLYVLMTPIISWFLYITEILESKRGVIR